MNQRSIHTDILEIAFEDGGPEQGPPVLLLHGWPDAPRGWNGVASSLQARGWRTIVPYLRSELHQPGLGLRDLERVSVSLASE